MKYKVNAVATTVMAAVTSTEHVFELNGLSNALSRCNSRQDFSDVLKPVQDAIRKALKNNGIKLEVVLDVEGYWVPQINYHLPNYRAKKCAHLISSFDPYTDKITVEVKEFNEVPCVKAEISEEEESVE